MQETNNFYFSSEATWKETFTAITAPIKCKMKERIWGDSQISYEEPKTYNLSKAKTIVIGVGFILLGLVALAVAVAAAMFVLKAFAYAFYVPKVEVLFFPAFILLVGACAAFGMGLSAIQKMKVVAGQGTPTLV